MCSSGVVQREAVRDVPGQEVVSALREAEASGPDRAGLLPTQVCGHQPVGVSPG